MRVAGGTRRRVRTATTARWCILIRLTRLPPLLLVAIASACGGSATPVATAPPSVPPAAGEPVALRCRLSNGDVFAVQQRVRGDRETALSGTVRVVGQAPDEGVELEESLESVELRDADGRRVTLGAADREALAAARLRYALDSRGRAVGEVRSSGPAELRGLLDGEMTQVARLLRALPAEAVRVGDTWETVAAYHSRSVQGEPIAARARLTHRLRGVERRGRLAVAVIDVAGESEIDAIRYEDVEVRGRAVIEGVVVVDLSDGYAGRVDLEYAITLEGRDGSVPLTMTARQAMAMSVVRAGGS